MAKPNFTQQFICLLRKKKSQQTHINKQKKEKRKKYRPPPPPKRKKKNIPYSKFWKYNIVVAIFDHSIFCTFLLNVTLFLYSYSLGSFYSRVSVIECNPPKTECITLKIQGEFFLRLVLRYTPKFSNCF